MASVFTKIIMGEIPAHEFHRDDHSIGFMSINPMAPGHALVVPLVEIDHWVDLPLEIAIHLTTVAHKVGSAQQRLFAVQRIGLIVAGFEVPHCHIHVIPTNTMADMDFANASTTADHELLASHAAMIRSAL